MRHKIKDHLYNLVMRQNCPYCNLLRYRDKRVLLRRKRVFVAFSDPRLMEGHLLVISKRHVEKPSELNSKERKEIFETAVYFQEKILKNIAPGCDMRQHYRPFIPQGKLKINHLHIHLQPRKNKDKLWEKTQKHEINMFRKLSEKERESVRKRLAK